MSQRPNSRRHSSGALSARTRKRIFAVLREKGLDDEARREIQIGIIGKASLTKFTEAEGRTLIDHLTGNRLRRGTAGRAQSPSAATRRKYRDPEGMLHVFVTPTITQPQIKDAYWRMHSIIRLEESLERRGEFVKPADWSDKPGARLDGWARNITDGDATRISELMLEEAVNLIELLKAGEQALWEKIKAKD